MSRRETVLAWAKAAFRATYGTVAALIAVHLLVKLSGDNPPLEVNWIGPAWLFPIFWIVLNDGFFPPEIQELRARRKQSRDID